MPCNIHRCNSLERDSRAPQEVPEMDEDPMLVRGSQGRKYVDDRMEYTSWKAWKFHMTTYGLYQSFLFKGHMFRFKRFVLGGCFLFGCPLQPGCFMLCIFTVSNVYIIHIIKYMIYIYIYIFTIYNYVYIYIYST